MDVRMVRQTAPRWSQRPVWRIGILTKKPRCLITKILLKRQGPHHAGLRIAMTAKE
jgi:hypothetical protein